MGPGSSTRGWLVSIALALALVVAAPAAASAENVYVSSNADGTISVFSVGAGGTLTSAPCNPVANCDTASDPEGVAIDPTGQHLYVADESDFVSVFGIGGSSTLAPVACTGSFNCTTGVLPFAIAVDPTGKYIYTGANNTGAIDPFAIGAGGALTPITCTTNCAVADPNEIAIDPNGHFLYSTSYSFGDGKLGEWSIASGGVPDPIACTPASSCETGFESTGIAVDPIAPYLYVTNATNPGTISIFKIGSNGAVTPVPCTPASSCDTANDPQSVAIDPSGHYVYVANSGSNTISIYSIGSTGALSPVSCSPVADCDTGLAPQGLTIDPSGRYLYAANNESGNVSEFAINASGTLTPLCDPSTSSCPRVNGPQLWSIAAAPDVGPSAAFTATTQKAGTPTVFNASGSASPDYPIATYAWSFGDGGTLETASPTTSHVYAHAGQYKVELAVIDEANCSDVFLYTGQTASCDGSQKADAIHTITVAAATPLLSGLHLSPSNFTLAGRKVKGHCVAATRRNRNQKACERTIAIKITYRLSSPAPVKLTAASEQTGRRAHGKCVAQTTRNRRDKRCTRTTKLSGSTTLTSKTGSNSHEFDGRIGRHRLGPGTYVLTLTPAGGKSHSATFRITP